MSNVEELIAMKWSLYAGGTLICSGGQGDGLILAYTGASALLTKEESREVAAHIVKVHNESLEQKEASSKNEKASFSWEYSRNRRQHWVVTEIDSPSGNPEWRIKDCADYRYIHKHSDGFDLYHFDKKIAHMKTVEELKMIAQTIANKKDQQRNRR